MRNFIKIALLDMNEGQPNIGIKNLKELIQQFINENEIKINISYELFDVRLKYEFPKLEDFDIYISSGGPGNPNFSGLKWEKKFIKFLNDIKIHNKKKHKKKYLFLICHSFQMAVIHWNIAQVVERESYSFGIVPIYKTTQGKKDMILDKLDQPFFAVDSRKFQCVKPKLRKMKRLNMSVLAIEKNRIQKNLLRAIMTIRFSDEIVGTQFHPEANPGDVICSLIDEKYKSKLIEKIGPKNYLEILELAEDEEKIRNTQLNFIPMFLKNATENLASNHQKL